MIIPWFYIWSPRYEIFHHTLSSSVMDCSGFQLNPCFFPQSAFDRIKVNAGDNPFCGNALKLRMILKELQSLPEDSPFILSDADIYLTDSNKFHSLCENEIGKASIVGGAEFIGNSDFMNMGLLLCRNNKEVRDFFTFLAELIESSGLLDQDLFNKNKREWVKDIGMFSTDDVIQTNMYKVSNKKFSAIQFLSSCDPKLLSSCDSKDMHIYEKLISASYLVDLTSVLHLVPYQIQEALVLFCKEHLPENPVCDFELSCVA